MTTSKSIIFIIKYDVESIYLINFSRKYPIIFFNRDNKYYYNKNNINIFLIYLQKKY
jgi:hypothetical protein